MVRHRIPNKDSQGLLGNEDRLFTGLIIGKPRRPEASPETLGLSTVRFEAEHPLPKKEARLTPGAASGARGGELAVEFSEGCFPPGGPFVELGQSLAPG